MKLRNLCTLIFLLFFSTLVTNAQELKTTEVSGETYGLSYNKADNIFTICENISTIDQKCSQMIIENKNTFIFQEDLKNAINNAIINNFKYEILGANVTLTDFNTIDYTKLSFDYDANKLSIDNNEIEINIKGAPDDFPKFRLKVKDKSNGDYELLNTNVYGTALKINYPNDISVDSNKTSFINSVMLQLNTKKNDIATYYKPKFESIIEVALLSLLEDLYNTTITKGTDYEFLVTEKLNDRSTPPVSKDYDFHLLLGDKKFNIRVYQGTNNVSFTDIDKDASEDEFISIMITKHPIFKANEALNEAALGKVYLSAISKVNDEKNEAEKDELKNLLRLADEDKPQYSAKIVLNDQIPYKIGLSNKKRRRIKNIISKVDNLTEEEKKTVFSDDEMEMFKKIKNIEEELNANNPSKKMIKGNGKLNILDAKLIFFNNKASSIYIKAELPLENGKREALIFYNNNYSVALRDFNNYGSVLSATKKNGVSIYIDCNDVFDYEADENFNYSIANSQITLSNVTDEGSKIKSYAKIQQRRFFDFFTGIIYSDLMGFNTDNANPLLSAQARLIVPLNLKNYDLFFNRRGKWTVFRQLHASTNIALSNSFENENRFISVSDSENVNNFELFKRNNLFGELGLEALTHQAKGFFTNISLGYKIRFYRTGFRYTQTQMDGGDIQTNRQILSVGHGPFLDFEIRPQNNFGANITVSLEELNFSDNNSISNRKFKGDIITEAGSDHLLLPYNMVSLNASFYWLTNPQKATGGIYANLGAFYHTESRSIFPQFMVGYATNLTSFVNRFKSVKPQENEEESDTD